MNKPPFIGHDKKRKPVYDLSGDKLAAAAGDEGAILRQNTAKTVELRKGQREATDL